MMRRTLFALTMLVAPVAAFAGPPLPRTELPIREVDLSDGARRYTVTLTIDGQAVEAGLDTGSTGLRVLPRALTPATRAAHGEATSYGYGSGTGFAGTVVRVALNAGDVAGTIRVMRIDQVGCLRDHSDCPVAHMDLARYGIQGDGLPGEGFAAILGIRLQADTVENPFTALGVRRWIVELPRPGGGGGRLVLDPDDAEVADYRRVHVDADGTAPGCLTGPPAQGRICAPAFFDSGAPGLRVIATRPPAPWANGTPVTLSIGSGDDRPSAPLVIGRRDQAAGMVAAVQPGARETRLSFGLAPYFIWSVLYDADRHEIGLKPR